MSEILPTCYLLCKLGSAELIIIICVCISVDKIVDNTKNVKCATYRIDLGMKQCCVQLWPKVGLLTMHAAFSLLLGRKKELQRWPLICLSVCLYVEQDGRGQNEVRNLQRQSTTRYYTVCVCL